MTRITRDQSPNPARVLSSLQQTSERMSRSTSAAATTATPSPIPAPVARPAFQQQQQQQPAEQHESEASASEDETESKKKQSLCPHARFRIHFNDMGHPAIAKFTTVIPLATLLEDAVRHVQSHLFTPPNPSSSSSTNTTTTTSTRPPPQHPTPQPTPTWKPQEVRSLTLVLRTMSGVAYTTGTDLDDAHKEIHLSLNYVQDIIDKFYHSPTTEGTPSHEQAAAASFLHEIRGVATHEAVHAFQHNACGSCPGGLIEGIADYVRLKAGLGAAHWNPWPASEKTRGAKWDAGYQQTAWFLDWVERQADLGGKGCIGRLNERMRRQEWEEGKVWAKVMGGVGVKECWARYVDDWEEMNRRHEREQEEKEDELYQEGTYL